jgi:ribulose-phosphate 3-epimerase
MNWLRMKEELQNIEALGIDYLHYDVADSYFVPEFGLPFYLIRKILENTSVASDYHLMVEEPRRIFKFIPRQPGARVSIHYEACRNLHRELVGLREMGFVPGLIINPATALEHLEYVIEEVELVTLMTVNPGFPGQKLVPQTLAKIEKLRRWRERANFKFDVIVDGNVSFSNIPAMVRHGADVLVLGTSGLLIPKQQLEESWKRLQEAIVEGLRLRGNT